MSRIAKSAIGALLALTLLVATSASVSHAIHQSLHHDGSAQGHICLACSFAKGQVNVAAAAVISTVVVFFCLWSIRQADASLYPSFDYHFSPSRAPPLA